MSDLISRQEAIRLAEQGQIQGFEWQFKKLCELPSAERTGKWIIQDGKVVCSQCFEPNKETDFCPHCGAKMVSV